MDISRVADQIPSLLHKSEFVQAQHSLESFQDSVRNDLGQLRDSTQSLQGEFHGIIDRFEGLRRENYEISTISRSFQAFRDDLALKAEKMDLFAVYDVMGKRDEI